MTIPMGLSVSPIIATGKHVGSFDFPVLLCVVVQRSMTTRPQKLMAIDSIYEPSNREYLVVTVKQLILFK